MEIPLFGEVSVGSLWHPDGHKKLIRMMRDGSVSMADFLQMLAFEGRVFGANFGSETGPLTLNTVYDQDQPDVVLRIPDGTAVVPIAVHCALEVSSGTVNEMSIVVVQNDIGSGTSSAATAGPLSLRTDAPITSNCVARMTYTANSSAFTNPLEVYRFGQELATAAGAFAPGTVSWVPDVKPVIIGPASLVVAFESTTTALQGFVQMFWAELKEAWL